MQEQTLEHHLALDHQNPNYESHQSQEWEAMARAWLSTMPEGRTLNTSEIEAWIESNQASLPEELISMPPSELFQRFTSIQNSMALPDKEKEPNQVEPHARFQRTDQWIPVYSWLESLNKDEVVKSKDISDWLSDNSKVKEQLCSRHSRYHLMHYIKKCHLKILKRREKKLGVQQHSNKAISVKVHKTGVTKLPAPLPCNSLDSLPKDDHIYLAKRNEAFRKYEILVELENQLSTLFSKQKNVNNFKES